ncbi:MAG: glycosyltransferase [Bacteroidota bacterium]
MEVKRIIFTVTNDLNYDQRMIRICNTLHDAGYDVLLVGREKKNSKPLLPQNFKQHRMKLWFEKGKLFYIEYNLRLFFFLLAKRFNIIYGVDLDSIVPCILISKLKNKPCIYDAHELFTETPEVERRKSIQRFWLRVEKFSVKRTTKGICVSKGLADYFKLKYGKDFLVVRNVPVITARLQTVPSNLPNILYQGTLNEGRGLEFLVEAMQTVNAKLVLAGEGDLSDQLRILVRELKLENKVEFKGFISPMELKKLTRNCYIGINLLEARSKNYYHSLANKFFDYTEAGIPSLNMRFPEYENLNKEFEVSILLADLNTEKITESLNNLLNNEQLYNRLKQNCLKAREEWNWEKEKEKLLKLFNEIH